MQWVEFYIKAIAFLSQPGKVDLVYLNRPQGVMLK